MSQVITIWNLHYNVDEGQVYNGGLVWSGLLQVKIPLVKLCITTQEDSFFMYLIILSSSIYKT